MIKLFQQKKTKDRKMKYSHIVWDFNGTILDDVRTGIISVNTLLSARGLNTIDSVEEYHRVFGFPIIEYYKRLGFDFDAEPYDKIAHEWVALYLENVKHAPLCPGVREILEEISSLGIPQMILSATEKDMLESQLSELVIRDYFSDVLGLDNIYAHSKVELGMAWMDKVKPRRALFIGDTEHDAKTAKSMGVECVLISGGHQSDEKLAECGVPVLKNLLEIKKFL